MRKFVLVETSLGVWKASFDFGNDQLVTLIDKVPIETALEAINEYVCPSNTEPED